MNATMRDGIDPSTEARGAAKAEQRPSPSPAAQRALQEAEARRAADADEVASAVPEQGGRGGLEPVRYGDWEVKGLASDF